MKSIVQYMNQEATKNNIKDTLGQKTPQFIASVASLVSSNPAIGNCEQKTIISACLIAASLDLPINQNLGFAYIIPYNQKGTMVAQFQMGYKGFIQLAMRSNQFKRLNASEVREGELKGVNRLTGEYDFEWSLDEERDKLPVIGYVAYMELKNGFSKQHYMSMKDLNAHGARFSQTYKRGFGLWKDDFDSMAKKTVLKLLLSKFAPMTVGMQTAIQADQAVIDGDKYEYADNEPIDATQVANETERKRIIEYIENATTAKDLEKCVEAVTGQDDEVQTLYSEKLKTLAK